MHTILINIKKNNVLKVFSDVPKDANTIKVYFFVECTMTEILENFKNYTGYILPLLNMYLTNIQAPSINPFFIFEQKLKNNKQIRALIKELINEYCEPHSCIIKILPYYKGFIHEPWLKIFSYENLDLNTNAKYIS